MKIIGNLVKREFHYCLHDTCSEENKPLILLHRILSISNGIVVLKNLKTHQQVELKIIGHDPLILMSVQPEFTYVTQFSQRGLR